MSKFLGSPKVQYFDSSGDPLNGGLLYTYEVGTTTNKATYPTIADAKAATNANANPVVLDSRGEANVVLAGNTKLVLKTSAGSTLWTVDNVNSDADILDANGNEMLTFTTAASATNFININSTATGTGPTITSAGSDTNVGLTIDTKGTGSIVIGSADTTDVRIASTTFTVDAGITVSSINTPLTITGSASSAGEVRLREDTDTGTNYISIKAPSSVTTDTTFILPNGDGTSGQFLTTNGSATLGWTTVTAAATQADQETGTSTTAYVTPGRQHFHQSAAKVWCSVSVGGGTPTLATPSYNVTSISDGGVGIYTVNYTTALSDADQACTASCTGSTVCFTVTISMSVSSTIVEVIRSSTEGLIDAGFNFISYGDI